MEDGQRARALAVVNRKGGVGKTTTAINLAHGLSRKLLRRVEPDHLDRVSDTSRLYQYAGRHYYISGHVLLIDFDSQGHCAPALGIDAHGADLGELLLGRQHLSQAVISADKSSDGYPRPNLWLLPASDNLETAKEALHSQSLEYVVTGYDSKEQWLLALLQRRLKQAKERFTYIILDCAPGLDIFALATYQFADSAIIPVKPDFLGMIGTGQHVGLVDEMQSRGIDIRIHTIVPTFNMPRQRLDQEMIAELKKLHGELLGDPIPRSQLVAESPAFHLTIFEYDSLYANAATVAYQNLVDRVYYG